MLHHHQVRRSSSFLGSRQWIRVGLPRLESCVSLCGWDDPLVCNEWIPVESDVRDLTSPTVEHLHTWFWLGNSRQGSLDLCVGSSLFGI